MEQMLTQQIEGLRAKKKELEGNEKLFIKAQGIDEEIVKSQSEVSDLDPEIQTLKETISELKAKKRESLSKTMESLAGKMSEVMPVGKALFDIDEDGKVFIGIQTEAGAVPYAGLSGGQKAAFDSALSYALLGAGEKLIIIEAAEMDYTRLIETIKSIEDNVGEDTQYIVNTWTRPRPGAVSEKWGVVTL